MNSLRKSSSLTKISKESESSSLKAADRIIRPEVALANVLSSDEAVQAARQVRQSPRRRTHGTCKFPTNDLNLLYVVPEAPTEASTLSRVTEESNLSNLSKSDDALNNASSDLLNERRNRFSNRQRSIDELKVDSGYAVPEKVVVKRPSLQNLHVYQNVRDHHDTSYSNVVIATNNNSSSTAKVPRKSSRVVYNQIDFAKTEALSNLRQHCMSERGVFPLPRC